MKRLLTKLYSQQIASAAKIRVAVWIEEHCAFGIAGTQANHQLGKIGTVAAHHHRLNSFGMVTTTNGANGGSLAFSPITRNVVSVKRSESDCISKPISPVNHGSHGKLVSGVMVADSNATARVNLSVDTTARQSFGEPFRSVNTVSVARPKGFAVPFNAATVELFRSQPSGKAFALPIHSQQHLGFVNHFALRGLPPFLPLARAAAVLASLLREPKNAISRLISFCFTPSNLANRWVLSTP